MNMVLLSFILSLVLLPALSYADPLHIQLVRSAPVPKNSEYFNFIAQNLRTKYRLGDCGLGKRSSKHASSASLTNENKDANYLATVYVGTPAQAFSVILDTGSSDFWVADTQCVSCPNTTKLFDSSKSSTWNKSTSTVHISYNGGAVNGYLAHETISLAGFTVSKQGFVAVEAVSQGTPHGTWSGIMGLAWPALSYSNFTPFWQVLTKEGKLSKPEFSFFLTRYHYNDSATYLEPGGTFTLGGTDKSLYTGNIEFHPLAAKPSGWILNLTSVHVQGNSVAITKGASALAALDTGTSIMSGPAADVTKFWAGVGGVPLDSAPGFFQYNCNKTLNVTLSFGGRLWPIDDRDMNLGQVDTGSTQCVGALNILSNITRTDGSPNWILGDSFLKNVYSVFRSNPPSVGLAKLSGASGVGI